MSNDAYFQKKWEECQTNMCKGCEFCNNCEHGVEFNGCETCHPPVIHKCRHGNTEGECQTCDDIEDARDNADAWEDSDCRHGVPGSECLECGAEMDALADKARERAEWNHFHPSEDTE